MAETQFDVVVIGAGPGGYVAAIRAAQHKLKVAIVESTHMGGICLNWGCIPTKALLKASEVKNMIDHADAYGLSVSVPVTMDWKKVIQRSRDVSKKLSQGVEFLMKKNKIEVVKGRGTLAGKEGAFHKVTVAEGPNPLTTLQAKNVILATGARARSLPGLEANGKSIWSYKEAMMAESCPKSLLVIGSGAIGIEFAGFYQAMGASVTVVEALDRVVPAEDHEISTLARKAFEKKGIQIHTGAKVLSLKEDKGQVEAQIDTGKGVETHIFDKALLAVGVVGNTENLGLEKTKVKVVKNQIETNEWLETGESGIYAIGDVAGAPWLAHKASHEGVLVADKIAGVKGLHPLDKTRIPGCTYCSPQIASIGMTEEKAKEKGLTIKVGRFPFMANGKALALGEPEGLVKTIFDATTGELLGAHMIGAEVTELIQGFSIAKAGELTEAELMHTIFPHPTLSEMMHESVLDAYGQAIHI